MLKFLVQTTLFFSIILSASSVSAISKCTLGGAVTYTNISCPPGAESTLVDLPLFPEDNAAAEKKRHAANQRELAKIQRQQLKEEKLQQQEVRSLKHQARLAKAHAFKCDELKFIKEAAKRKEAKTALQNNIKAKEKAQNRLRQASNDYAYYCDGD